MSHRGVVPAMWIMLAVAATPGGGATACTFDLDENGTADLVVPDADGDGICDFPDDKTHVHGTLRFRAGDTVQLRGRPVIEADRIVIEEGATIVGDPATLLGVTLLALHGDLLSFGTLHIVASDDVTFGARQGSLLLEGATLLSAVDRLLIEIRDGWLEIAPTDVLPTPFTLFGGNRVDLRTRTAIGGITLDGARIGGRTVSLDASANLSFVDEKPIDVRGGTLITTDRLRTGLAWTGDIALRATGDVDLGPDATLDSGRNLVLRTQRTGDGVCLESGAVLQARDTAGHAMRIDLRGVRGDVLDDGGDQEDGTVLQTGERGGCGGRGCAILSVADAGDLPTEDPAPAAPAPLVAPAAPRQLPPFPTAMRDEHNRARTATNNLPQKKNDPANPYLNPQPNPKLDDVEWDDALAVSAQFVAEGLKASCACRHSRNAQLEALKPVTDLPDLAQRVADLRAGKVDGLNWTVTLQSAQNAITLVKDCSTLQTATGLLAKRDGTEQPYQDQQKTKPKLVFTPRQGKTTLIEGFECVGENIAKVPGKNLAVAALARATMQNPTRANAKADPMWEDELLLFDYANTTVKNDERCEKPNKCGHYTQIVWRETNLIGCGKVECQDTTKQDYTIVVCQYLEAGNFPEKVGSSLVRTPY